MVEFVIRLPDVGEGVAEAELVEWHVAVGDLVREDQLLASVMTDKATVEIPSPVDGEVLWLGAEIGEVVAVGGDLVRLKVAGDTAETPTPAAAPNAAPPPPDERPRAKPSAGMDTSPAEAKPVPDRPVLTPKPTAQSPSRVVRGAPRPEGEKPLASPAVRLRAREAGIDLRQLRGSGPAGRITHQDIDTFLAHGTAAGLPAGLTARVGVEEIRIVGLRRKIAERLSLSKRRIPHITYIEEIDVGAVEDLRAKLNASKRPDQPKLTLLPFLMRAMVRAIGEQPHLNALFDDEAGILHRHEGVHIGIAAQTAAGLVVPVVRHAEALDIWGCGSEVNRLADAAKAGTATREELSGSTITITSLGALGGIATTPVINHPEVAIVGVNKIAIRPVWDGAAFSPRRMMNLSSSFDHRIVDGWDAAVFVQRIKTLLETPALIFVESPVR